LSVNIQCDGDLMYAPGVLWTAFHHRIPLLSVMHRRIAVPSRVTLVAALGQGFAGLRARLALDAGLPAMRAVGYRQVWDTLEGVERADTLEARGIAATRRSPSASSRGCAAWRASPARQTARAAADLAAAVRARVAPSSTRSGAQSVPWYLKLTLASPVKQLAALDLDVFLRPRPRRSRSVSRRP
jgi:hypothetical protein